jgi:UDP-glucose 4-epimerase
VVDANEVGVRTASGEMVNLGTGIGTSVNQIFRELQAILGFSGEPIYEAARPGEVQRIFLDASRARRVLGWTPRTAFRDGLERTVEWTRAAAA